MVRLLSYFACFAAASGLVRACDDDAGILGGIFARQDKRGLGMFHHNRDKGLNPSAASALLACASGATPDSVDDDDKNSLSDWATGVGEELLGDAVGAVVDWAAGKIADAVTEVITNFIIGLFTDEDDEDAGDCGKAVNVWNTLISSKASYGAGTAVAPADVQSNLSTFLSTGNTTAMDALTVSALKTAANGGVAKALAPKAQTALSTFLDDNQCPLDEDTKQASSAWLTDRGTDTDCPAPAPAPQTTECTQTATLSATATIETTATTTAPVETSFSMTTVTTTPVVTSVPIVTSTEAPVTSTTTLVTPAPLSPPPPPPAPTPEPPCDCDTATAVGVGAAPSTLATAKTSTTKLAQRVYSKTTSFHYAYPSASAESTPSIVPVNGAASSQYSSSSSARIAFMVLVTILALF